MDKEIYPVGSVVRVTTTHRALSIGAHVGAGTRVVIDSAHRAPYSNVRYYKGYTLHNKEVVTVSDLHVELEALPTPETLPVGSLVFVTETHSVKEGYYLKAYAGSHLTITEFSAGFADVPAHYWGTTEAGENRTLAPDKIALVETEPEKPTPPVAPSYVGKQGEVVWKDKDLDEGGYWTYDNYWGWSNFVPVVADLWKKPVLDEDMGTNGVLATSALDGSVHVV